MRLFGAILGISLLFVLAFTTSTEIVAQDKTEVVKVTAKQLLTDYKGDENEKDLKKRYKEADDKYKGKMLEITGVVSNVIGATSPYFLMEGGTGLRAKLYCAFGSDKNESFRTIVKAKQLTKGATVILTGTCSGMKGKNVQIDDCIMIDPPFPK